MVKVFNTNLEDDLPSARKVRLLCIIFNLIFLIQVIATVRELLWGIVETCAAEDENLPQDVDLVTLPTSFQRSRKRKRAAIQLFNGIPLPPGKDRFVVEHNLFFYNAKVYASMLHFYLDLLCTG